MEGNVLFIRHCRCHGDGAAAAMEVDPTRKHRTTDSGNEYARWAATQHDNISKNIGPDSAKMKNV